MPWLIPVNLLSRLRLRVFANPRILLLDFLAVETARLLLNCKVVPLVFPRADVYCAAERRGRMSTWEKERTAKFRLRHHRESVNVE